MLVYFAFADTVAIATSAMGLLRLPAKSKSRTCASFAGQLCVKITLPPVPVKLHTFMRRITDVIDLFLNDYYSIFLVIDKDVAFVCILSAFLWRRHVSKIF